LLCFFYMVLRWLIKFPFVNTLINDNIQNFIVKHKIYIYIYMHACSSLSLSLILLHVYTYIYIYTHTHTHQHNYHSGDFLFTVGVCSTFRIQQLSIVICQQKPFCCSRLEATSQRAYMLPRLLAIYCHMFFDFIS
jgi:hypothetical protein